LDAGGHALSLYQFHHQVNVASFFKGIYDVYQVVMTESREGVCLAFELLA